MYWMPKFWCIDLLIHACTQYRFQVVIRHQWTGTSLNVVESIQQHIVLLKCLQSLKQNVVLPLVLLQRQG